MRTTKPKKSVSKKKLFPWRKNPKKWTDTLFEKKLLQNPSLMTSHELADAIEEHQSWRTSYGKYLWEKDPIKENAESEPPFSPMVLTKLIWEAISRLRISGDLHIGRLKRNV